MKIGPRANGTSRQMVVTILLAAGLALAGCANEDTPTSPPPPADQEKTGQLQEVGDGEDIVEAQETDPATQTIDMTAEDGFNGPLPVDHDHAPGTGELVIGDERIAMELGCTDPSVHRNWLFTLIVRARGEDSAGHPVGVEAQRVISGQAEPGPDGYHGQELSRLMVQRQVERTFLPNSVGAGVLGSHDLPIVWITEDGRFAAVADLGPAAVPAADDEEFLHLVPEGEALFTGTCPTDWPGPIMDRS